MVILSPDKTVAENVTIARADGLSFKEKRERMERVTKASAKGKGFSKVLDIWIIQRTQDIREG